MDTARPPSPAALRLRHPGSTAQSVVLLVLWLVVSVLGASDDLSTLLETQLLCAPAAVGGGLLLARGVRASRRSRCFDAADRALADSLDVSLARLCQAGTGAAYRTDPRATELADVRLLRVERHFDEQSASGTTRTTPLGDALFAVVEAPGPAGPRDTYRVVSLSPAAAAGWVHDLVGQAAMRFGGPDSHAGSTLLRWGGPLAAHFAPPDVAYASDRLLALTERAEDDREPVVVRGHMVAHNTVLAAHICLGTEAPLLVTPMLFPALLDHAITSALARAEAALPEAERPRLRLAPA